MAAYALHDDRRASDPRAFSDANERSPARLIANRPVNVCGAVCLRTARYVDARCEEHVTFEVDEAQMTARADVDICIQVRADLAEDRAELHSRCSIAVGEHVRQKCTSQVTARDTRKKSESLSRSLERPVGAKDQPANRE